MIKKWSEHDRENARKVVGEMLGQRPENPVCLHKAPQHISCHRRQRRRNRIQLAPQRGLAIAESSEIAPRLVHLRQMSQGRIGKVVFSGRRTCHHPLTLEVQSTFVPDDRLEISSHEADAFIILPIKRRNSSLSTA